MTGDDQVQVLELVAWGIDENIYRPQIQGLLEKVADAHTYLDPGKSFTADSAALLSVPASARNLLVEQHGRADLRFEMQELDWTTGIVDLHSLLAFQRRLVFDTHYPIAQVPASGDWPALAKYAFGHPAPIAYKTLAASSSKLVLQSENPNLQVRLSAGNSETPFEIHGGSPFFEVAEYRGRWFLRDGYHRAHQLLRANIVHVPAVIIRARTLAELGPVQPWFFSEDILFSSSPPHVIDFLDDNLTIHYARPRLLKTLRITVEESVEPAQSTCCSGGQQ